MKKLFSFLLVLAVLISVCTVGAGAVRAPHFYGEVNGDHVIDIMDATEIQRHLARFVELSDLSKELADVDGDSIVAVMDATMIQRKEAGIIRFFNQTEIYTYTDINNVTADFEDGKAMAGVPVTFNISAHSRSGNPLRYELKVNDVVVLENTEPVFTYTFEEAGEYKIEILIYNKFDEIDWTEFYYRVVEKPQEQNLIISAINKNHSYLNVMYNIELTAHAYGGTAPYEFSFEMPSQDLKQEYSENSTFAIGKLPIGTYEVNVSVKDADGNVVEEVYTFEVEELRIG